MYYAASSRQIVEKIYLNQWALIASRINVILGLALDFYSVQQTLSSGGAVSAIKLRCEMEVDRIEKQFDDCIAFLLRVSLCSLFSLITIEMLKKSIKAKRHGVYICVTHKYVRWSYLICKYHEHAGPVIQAKRGALPSLGRSGYKNKL